MVVLGLLVLPGLLGGCRLSRLGHLEFTKDNRLSFTAPDARSLVTLPLTVSWSMRDFAAGPAGSYAVFVDRSPIGVGDDVGSVSATQPRCRNANPLCSTPAFLAGEGIYVTTTPGIVVASLPSVANGKGDEQHQVAVVLLDAGGVRRSESAWYVGFRYPRRSSA